MANYPIGGLIAEMRNRQNLSQEELTEGICAVSTLSKIENGVQMPSRKVYEALMQRLGIPSRSCQVYVGKIAMCRSLLEERLENFIVAGQYEKAAGALMQYILCDEWEEGAVESYEAKLEAYAVRLGLGEKSRLLKGRDLVEEILISIVLDEKKKCVTGLSRLEVQYALHQLGVLTDQKHREYRRALRLSEFAIRLTIPDFSEDGLDRIHLLTRIELYILCHMGLLYNACGDRLRAKRFLSFLKEYMERRYMDSEEKGKIYPVVVFYLGKWMGEKGNFDRQLELCESGIALCLRQGRLAMLPQLLTAKGHALISCGKQAQAEPILKQACLILQLFGDSVTTE